MPNADRYQLLEANNIPVPKGPLDHHDLKRQAEQHEQDIIKQLGPLDPALEEITQEIEMRDGHKHQLRIIRPSQAPPDGSPLVICYHGGGFNSGTPYDVEPYARGIAKLFAAVVVAPTYCLAPEHPFPAGPNDAWDAFKWTAANAANLGAAPHKGFILSGGSAGGNFVCVLAELAKSEKTIPPLTGIWSCVPILFNEDVTDAANTKAFASTPDTYRRMLLSWTQNAHGIMMNRDVAHIFFDWYKPDFASAMWSPFNSATAFKGLPRTFVQVAGKDLIRDDGIIYARALVDHGVETRLVAYPGVPHAFWIGLPQLKQAKQFMMDIAFGLAWLLDREVDMNKVKEAMRYPGVDYSD